MSAIGGKADIKLGRRATTQPRRERFEALNLERSVF
jgi:hypothetical protein